MTFVTNSYHSPATKQRLPSRVLVVKSLEVSKCHTSCSFCTKAAMVLVESIVILTFFFWAEFPITTPVVSHQFEMLLRPLNVRQVYLQCCRYAWEEKQLRISVSTCNQV